MDYYSILFMINHLMSVKLGHFEKNECKAILFKFTHENHDKFMATMNIINN